MRGFNLPNWLSRLGARPPGAAPEAAAFPGQGQVSATEALLDVVALAGEALVLDNGAFVRLLEVAPVDLERGDPALKHRFWGAFAGMLRRLRAPLSLQIVVSARPQEIADYLARWDAQAAHWEALAAASADDAGRGRRHRMRRGARETAAFLAALHERVRPLQQRYLVVVTHNPFAETVTHKTHAQLMDDRTVAGALEQLAETVAMVRAALGEIGLPVYDLDPGAACQAVWEHYHRAPSGPVLVPAEVRQAVPEVGATPLSQCPPAEAFHRAARDPGQLADLLAPALIEEQAHFVRVGEVVARGYLIYDFDPRAPVDLAALLALPADITHALYLSAADPVVIRQQFKEKETELRAAMLMDAQRGAVTDWARQAAVQSLEAARAEMETALQAPYFLHWYSLVWANDLPALEKQCQAFETLLKVRDIRFHPATRRHLSVLQSTRPLARPAYKLKPRNMSADSLGSFFPFVRRDYLDPRGWHFGLHRGNGLLVCLNPFTEGQTNASQLVIGTPGSGKSVYLKQAIETVLALGHRVFVIDPEREYLRLAVDFHAPYVELGKAAEARTLVFETARAEGYAAGLVGVGELYEALAAAPLTPPQIDRLAAAYQTVMTAHGIRMDAPETWARPAPPLAALLAELRAMGEATATEVARVLAYAEALGGGHVLNLLDLSPAAENPWSASAEALAAFVEALLGHRLSAADFNVLVEAYQHTLTAAGLPLHDRAALLRRPPMPTLSALVQTLEDGPHPRGRELAQVLQPYARGLYADVFNQPTSVDPGAAQLMVFGLRSLRESTERSLAPVLAWQMLRLVWNEVAAGGAQQPVHLFIDEAWYLLEQPGAAQRLERMARSFRKYNAALYLATQDAHKLVASPEARAIAEIARLKLLFGQEAESAVRGLGELFGLTALEQADLLRARPGEGLLLAGSDVRLPLLVAVNPQRLGRLSTNREQQQAVARASGRLAQPVV